MSEFYNPYAFIPVTGKVNGSDTPTTPYEDSVEGKKDGIKQGHDRYIRHDLWTKDAHSGRIVCSLKLKTPLVVGAKHEYPDDDTETKVIPYRFDEELAIPGNSLRGMVTSIVEAISQSSLRVLEKATYSVRKEAGEGLSAVGMLHQIIQADGKKRLVVLPISLPLLELHSQGSSLGKWQDIFAGVPLAQCLPAYVDGYESQKDGDKTVLAYAIDSFLDINRPTCFHGRRPEYWYAKITNDSLKTTTAEATITNKSGLKVIANRLVGQVVEEVISAAEYEHRMDECQKTYRKNPSAMIRKQQQYVRGVLHVLGIEKRVDEIPDTKHHERFLPWPASRKPTPLPVRSDAWNRFLQLAAERADASKREKVQEKKLPLQAQSYLQHKNPEALWKPSVGELVFFDIDNKGYVCDFSYTSIWRRGIKGNIHDAFEKRIGINLPPWGHPSRTCLTPAESLFGVTPYAKVGDKLQSQSLASRVRFFDGFSVRTPELEQEIPLKILSSPKPPSPAMYFREGVQTRKRDLVDMSAITPNGRKYYIPHKSAENPMRILPWRSASDEHRNQKILCTPLSAGQTFYFHVDFDQLSFAELTLLQKALQPGGNFRHRLGLGKALGLGAVSVGICGTFFIDRFARYQTNELGQARYSSVAKAEWPEELNARYKEEAKAVQFAPDWSGKPDLSLVDDDTLKIVLTVGDPVQQQDVPIRYPYTLDQNEYCETDGFEWFVANDKLPNDESLPAHRRRQALSPVQPGDLLPTLAQNRKPPR